MLISKGQSPDFLYFGVGAFAPERQKSGFGDFSRALAGQWLT